MIEKYSLGPLKDGAKVVIIGGGPGGTSCALRLKQLAHQMDRRLDITVVECKQFFGEQQHNQCVGVLAPPLSSLMVDQLDVPFPSHLSQAKIKGYYLHTNNEQVCLRGEEKPSIALRRVQFDAYMLENARQRGIKIMDARVVDLEFHADCAVVYTDSIPLECDVVIGAFGLDEGTAAVFSRVTSYRPPQSLSTIVTKYHPSDENMAKFDSYIHAYLLRNPRLEFGAVTPKANHLTINIAGESVDYSVMQAFLALPAVKAVLPDLDRARQLNPNDLKFFKGHFPCSLAHHYYGNRYVLVGDAAGLVRAFKGKGVTSAVQTGIRAAESILRIGISEWAFQSEYDNANRDITGDLPYGHTMRLLTLVMSHTGLMDAVVRAGRTDLHLQQALFDAVSAHGPYRDVLIRALHPKSMIAITREIAAPIYRRKQK